MYNRPIPRIAVQCVCFVVHAVYPFTSSPLIGECTVHLEVKGGGGGGGEYHVLNSVGGKGNYWCGNLLHTL